MEVFVLCEWLHTVGGINSETLDESYDSWEHEDCLESMEVTNAN